MELFDSMMRGYAPLTSGRAIRMSTGLEGLPFMDQGGPSGLAMQLIGGPVIQGLMGQSGMMPFGLGHDQNIYDLMRRRQFMQSQQEAMQLAAESDREGYMKTFRGLAAMTNTPWGSQQRQAARALSDTAVQFSPIMAQIAPDLLDQMGGMQGSAAVMAQRMMAGSRYRIDPLTGQMGQSANTVGQMARDVFKDLYSYGKLADMKGISAGQVGGMYDELTRRGMISGRQSTSAFRTYEALQDMSGTNRKDLERAAANTGVKLPADLADLNAGELDKLRGDSAISDKLKSFDSEKVKKSLKSYVDVVSAMRDVFGDMGRANAPMAELIAGLEAMTQGSVGKIDPGRLNMMVRNTHELAKQSGMSMEAAMMVQQHAASRAEALGINPLHAVQAAQGTMAWGSAFKAQGGSSVAAWDRFNADQMSQLDANLRVQAAASPQANRLGALMRIRERVGGFQEGSEAQAMAQAVQLGQTEFFNPRTGKVESTMMPEGSFAKTITRAKGRNGEDLRLSEGDVMSMLQERSSNEQFIQKYDISDQVRRQQPMEAGVRITSQTRISLRNRLISAGMDAVSADKAATQAASGVTSRTQRLSEADFAGDQTRTSRMSEIIRDELSGTAAGEFLAKQGLGKGFYDMTAERVYGGVNEMLKRDPRLRFQGYQNYHAVMNADTLEQADKNRWQARFTSEVAEDLSPLGRGTALQRTVQYLKEAGPKADIPELISQALGGVKNSDINKAMQAPLVTVQLAQKQLEDMQSKFLEADPGPEKDKLHRRIESQRDTLKASVTKLLSLAEKNGIYADQDALDISDVTNAKGHLRKLAGQTQDIHHLRGNFGFDGTPEDIKRREAISLTPEKSEIQAILETANKGKNEDAKDYMSVGQAEAIATSRRRAQRYGITDRDITAARNSFEGSVSEDRVLDKAFQNKYAAGQEVSLKEIDAFRALSPENAKLSQDKAREGAQNKKEQDNKKRWFDFWHSESGAQFRESSEQTLNAVNDVATKVIMSDKQMARLGPQAIEKYQQMRGHEARLKTLSLYHTNGDVGRLMAGDFNLDNSTADERAKLRHEVLGIQNQFGASLNFFETQLNKPGRDWGDIDVAARKLLNLPSKGLTAEQHANLTKTKRSIETAQKLDDTVVDSLKERDRLSGKVQADATLYGLSREDMTNLMEKGIIPAGKRAATYTPLSADESKTIGVARESYRHYASERSNADKRLRALDSQLEDKALGGAERKTLEQERVGVLAEREKKSASMKSALATAAAIATSRGVTPQELVLENKGSMTAEARDNVKADLSAYAKLQVELEQKAKALGIPGGIAGLDEGNAALKKVGELTKKFQGLENTDTSALVRNLFKDHGLDVTKNQERISRIAAQTGDDTGRTFLRQLIGTGAQLRDVAGRGRANRKAQAEAETDKTKRQMLEAEAAGLAGRPDDPMSGVAAMVKEYESINNLKQESEREDKLKQFRKDYGIRSEEEFNQVRQAMRFQSSKGILNPEITDADKRAEALSHGVDTMKRGVSLGYNSQLTEDQWREMRITGQIHVTGEIGDVNARGEHATTQKGS